MKLTDTLELAFKALSQHKVRTALTILMVVIGITAIVALVSLTTGVQVSIEKSLESLGPTTIVVSYAGNQGGFSAADLALISSLPNVSSVTPMIRESATLTLNGQTSQVSLIGISKGNLLSIVNSTGFFSGSVYPNNETGIAVVGNGVAFSSSGQQLLNLGSPIDLLVHGPSGGATAVDLATDGILNSYGASLFLPVDSSIFISTQEAQLLFPNVGYSTFLVKAVSTNQVSSLSTEISDAFGKNVVVETTQQLAQTVSSIMSSITLLLLVITAISLLVAAVGIMNIMFVSVLERTKEIGILKTVGFSNTNILLSFVFEAFIIGLVGGLVGIGAGIGASQFVHVLAGYTSGSSISAPSGANSSSFSGGSSGAFANSRSQSAGFGSPSSSSSTSSSSILSSFSPVFTPELLLLALFVAISVSVAAGLYPAIKASRMQPIEAIRHE